MMPAVESDASADPFSLLTQPQARELSKLNRLRTKDKERKTPGGAEQSRRTVSMKTWEVRSLQTKTRRTLMTTTAKKSQANGMLCFLLRWRAKKKCLGWGQSWMARPRCGNTVKGFF